MLDSEGHCKLSDFGICEENVVPGIKMADTFSGTKWYMMLYCEISPLRSMQCILHFLPTYNLEAYYTISYATLNHSSTKYIK